VQTVYISKEGYEKLKKELDYLLKVKRKELVEAIQQAREFGDLKENAEYKAAKEAQSLNEIKIKELSTRLSAATILEDIDIPADKVYIGATAHLHDLDRDEEIIYTLVSESEADILENKISVGSPIGRGLLGKKVEDEVEIQVPAGILRYKILKITRE